MSFLNNMKITFKIALMVILLAAVSIGAIAYASYRMEGIDDAYSDLADRVGANTILTVRGTRQGAATQEISRNVQQAAQGTTQVASNISNPVF